jgi:O-antigen ligase
MLAEMGLVGFFALLLTIALLFRAGLIMRRNTINSMGPTPIVYFDLALLASPILVGFFESGLFSSSSSQGVFFGFAAGLIDRFSTMVMLETQERHLLLAAGAVSDEFEGAIFPLDVEYSDVGHVE